MSQLSLNSQINLKLTQESGQTSQPPWKEIDNSYCNMVSIANTPILIKISQNNVNRLNIDYELPISNQNLVIDEIAIENEINKIFDLKFDLNKFYDYLSNDSKLEPAIDFCRGLRLFLANDPFECVISSITSANNSITRWTKSIAKIKEKWGDSCEFSSGIFYSFPSSKKLMCVYEDQLEEYEAIRRVNEIECCKLNLKSCGVGYRAQYIKKASELFTLEMNLFEIPKMSYEEAFDLILATPGVGPKVADCILLYGYGFTEAFPSDIWIKRIISHLYFDGKDISVNKVRDFGMDHFGDYAGYVQLYLFHYARKSGLMNKLK